MCCIISFHLSFIFIISLSVYLNKLYFIINFLLTMSEPGFSSLLEICFGVEVLLVWVLFTVLLPFQLLKSYANKYASPLHIWIVNNIYNTYETLRIIKAGTILIFTLLSSFPVFIPDKRMNTKSTIQVSLWRKMPVPLPLEASPNIESMSVSTAQGNEIS